MPHPRTPNSSRKPDWFDLEPPINQLATGCATLMVLANTSETEVSDNIIWAIDKIHDDISKLQELYNDLIKTQVQFRG